MKETRLTRKLPRNVVLIGAIVLAAAGIALWIARAPAPATKETKADAVQPALTVSTIKPVQTDLPIQLQANGNIVAWQEAIIGSEANGLRLAKLVAHVGDRVRAGQVLAEFAAETVEADVAQARAALLEAKATATEAAANAKRARALQPSGAFSAQQAEQLLTAEETAKARVAAAEATLATQQLRLKQTRLLAPDDGIISARNATIGAVMPAGTEMFRLIRQSRLEWRAEVTAAELARLQPGTRATVAAANGVEVKGKVRVVGPTVDPQSRFALVYVDLPPMPAAGSDKDAGVRPGMFGKGAFHLGSSRALTVPQPALVVRDGFSYLFRINPDHRVSQLKVQTGRRVGDQVEVLGDLTPDSVLVASGAGFLNDGDMVRIVQAVPAGQQPTAAESAR